MTQKIFGIVGWKNSGKTTLTERLVKEIIGRGYKVATIKHAHHAFDIDQEGTDSFRHRAAGAGEIAIVSGRRWAIIHELHDEEEPPLRAMLQRMSPCDLVLIEGFKRESHPKIECRRSSAKDTTPLSVYDPTVAAIASDHEADGEGLPVFRLDDVAVIADFILTRTGLGTG